MNNERTDIRLALPSKGRLAEEALAFLRNTGLPIHKPNPRQYQASIPLMPGLTILFQRAGDIAISLHNGSVDFGITGWDVLSEYCDVDREIITMQPDLGFGGCTLQAIVPENWQQVNDLSSLKKYAQTLQRPLRIATKFPQLTRQFFTEKNIQNIQIIRSEGTLEIAPAMGYADLIVDLVSSGLTLRDNRLKQLQDGLVLASQACLAASRIALETRPAVLEMARQLSEYIEAHLRARAHVAIFANMRADSPEIIASRMFEQLHISGLQGPTISPVFTQDEASWFAVHVIVRRDELTPAMRVFREIGASGIVVAPVTYIFEENPASFRRILTELEQK